jgi:tRNA/rRNA methyltransferase
MLPTVILVRPQMGENIGAVARAMSNFGLKNMRLVAPRDGWPNAKALEMAAGGESQIETAEIFDDVASAIHDLQWLYATTARARDIEKQVLTPKAAMQQMAGQNQQAIKTGLIFGPERSGLENEDIARCHTLITIPTSPDNSSLNLAQSMVILGYEWWQHHTRPANTLRDLPDIAPGSEWEGMYGQLEQYLDEAAYFRVAEKKPVMWQNLRNMLQRSAMNSQELRTFRGMLRSLWEAGPRS